MDVKRKERKMKSKLGILLLIIGGVLASQTTQLVTVPLVISVVGGFLLGFSYLLFTSVYGGKVWGIKVKSSTSGKIMQLLSIIGLVVGGYSVVSTGLVVFVSLFRFDMITLITNIVGFVIPLAIGPFVAKIIAEKALAKTDTAFHFGELEIFKEIDKNIDSASDFVVGFEGVALFNSANYCYAVYLYENYQLGTLTKPEEVALVGTYFVQKYADKFTFKVDVEVIPGEPGQTVVAVGTGGIGVARIQGTPDKRLFRSYIFKRRKEK